jgi:hypothetical protein
MAGTLTISTLSDGTNSTSATNPILGSAKAWVNFDGTSGTRRASYNVSSVTRTATGTYTVTFTNALPDANYAIVCGTSAANGSNDGGYMGVQNGTTPTTSSFGLVTDGRTTGEYDPTFAYVAVFD